MNSNVRINITLWRWYARWQRWCWIRHINRKFGNTSMGTLVRHIDWDEILGPIQ